MAQVIFAPDRPIITGQRIIFLAGTTTRVNGTSDWRETLTASLATLPITIMNPMRLNWDDTWRQDPSFTPFREQVQWELEMQNLADLVVVYFAPGTDAPISLLEFGLCARRPGKALVMCHDEYPRRGNVRIVCEMTGVPCLHHTENLGAEIRRRLGFGPNCGPAGTGIINVEGIQGEKQRFPAPTAASCGP